MFIGSAGHTKIICMVSFQQHRHKGGRRTPAALVMLSLMREPPMSLQPAASRPAARSGPIFTHDAWMFGSAIPSARRATACISTHSRSVGPRRAIPVQHAIVAHVLRSQGTTLHINLLVTFHHACMLALLPKELSQLGFQAYIIHAFIRVIWLIQDKFISGYVSPPQPHRLINPAKDSAIKMGSNSRPCYSDNCEVETLDLPINKGDFLYSILWLGTRRWMYITYPTTHKRHAS